jgi:hypothetical protein
VVGALGVSARRARYGSGLYGFCLWAVRVELGAGSTGAVTGAGPSGFVLVVVAGLAVGVPTDSAELLDFRSPKRAFPESRRLECGMRLAASHVAAVACRAARPTWLRLTGSAFLVAPWCPLACSGLEGEFPDKPVFDLEFELDGAVVEYAPDDDGDDGGDGEGESVGDWQDLRVDGDVGCWWPNSGLCRYWVVHAGESFRCPRPSRVRKMPAEGLCTLP